MLLDWLDIEIYILVFRQYAVGANVVAIYKIFFLHIAVKWQTAIYRPANHHHFHNHPQSLL